MVPRNAMTKQTLQRSHGPVLVLCQVLADQSQPLLLRRVDGRLQFLGGVRKALCGGRKEGPQGRNGSVNPLRLRRRGTIAKP